MSVHERKRAGGKRVYQVTWRDLVGRQRAETYPDRRSAERRNAEIADLRWEGRLNVVDAGTEPLRDAAEEWWTDHVEPVTVRLSFDDAHDSGRAGLRNQRTIIMFERGPRDFDPALGRADHIIRFCRNRYTAEELWESRSSRLSVDDFQGWR